MELGASAYLVTTLIFAGGALAVELLVDFRRLWAYRRLLAVMIAVALFLTLVGESTALAWRIWAYNPERTFDLTDQGPVPAARGARAGRRSDGSTRRSRPRWG